MVMARAKVRTRVMTRTKVRARLWPGLGYGQG